LFFLINDILEPPEEPDTIQIADENTFLFMQDNAPCHKAMEVLEFLAERNIPTMEWPPDLNPIENLWAAFKEAFSQVLYGDAQSSVEES
jgi:transposase